MHVASDKILGELALQVRLSLDLLGRQRCRGGLWLGRSLGLWGILLGCLRRWGGWLASDRRFGGWLRGRWWRRCRCGGRWRISVCCKRSLRSSPSAILRLHLDHHGPGRWSHASNVVDRALLATHNLHDRPRFGGAKTSGPLHDFGLACGPPRRKELASKVLSFVRS
jgi:hypothetical protein